MGLKRWFHAVVLSCAGLCLVPAPGFSDTVVRIAGSTTVLPVVSRAATAFTERHPDVKVTVNSGGSGVGIQGAGAGRLDIGLASRELTPQEQTRFQAANLKLHAIGSDAVACVVSSEIHDAGVHSLSRNEIRDIYRGVITNWKQVGGPDRPIVVIDKERHRGTRHVFMRYVFGNEQARAPGARLVTGSNNEEQAKIAQSDSAIGMLSFAWMNEHVKGVALREGKRTIAPTLRNVQNGSYPIVRHLNLVTRGAPRGMVRKLLNYIQGPEGQALVRSGGYVPYHPSEGSRLTDGSLLDKADTRP